MKASDENRRTVYNVLTKLRNKRGSQFTVRIKEIESATNLGTSQIRIALGELIKENLVESFDQKHELSKIYRLS